MRSNKIRVFYNPKQVLQSDINGNFSKSPLKPKLLLEHLEKAGLGSHLDIVSKFRPFNAYDFQIAHTIKYIKDFFTGGKLSTSNNLTWSPQFAESVRYTNASLYEAIQNSLVNPSEVSFSPTSGFHHAKPDSGMGFCTFSGQVIASVKAYRKFGAVGCYLDLDGHFGNSIENSRDFQPDLNLAVPRGFNFNTHTTGEDYYKELTYFVLKVLTPAILLGKIDYVVWCHGADSHKDDALGNQVNTEQWVRCSKFFWSWVNEMDKTLGRPLSVSCALFGGYRHDDYNSVLSLHASDLRECMNCLLKLNVEYTTQVKAAPKPSYYGTFIDNTPTYSQSQSLRNRRERLDEVDRLMKAQRDRERRNEEEFERYYANRYRRL